ncbi:hypothetical protein OH76DRAFT_1404137 [Lentinus brumalis]|uniref:BTB domain-containing protein n=1 Tax=Lentinus brumalis TaxID=2498619 RepID=A0A371D8S8_9APHY|nr:hypothetical protein OH76DRAFT_1404137 [Polyporus brumalis]
MEDFKRDSELWYGDGTIILVASGLGFKVYKDILVKQSLVFEDMLSFPQPPSVEGQQACPIVPMPDSAEDLRHFLRFLMPAKKPRTFNSMSACIRLGHKYQIDSLVEDSLPWFSKLYPSDFATLDKHRPKPLPPTCAIATINIARLTGADYLLPMALAECCQLGAEIVNGHQREDGTREYLALDDLGRCFQAQRKLIEARVFAIERIVNQDLYGECKNEDGDLVEEFHEQMREGAIPGFCSPNFWESIGERITSRFPEICRQCRKELATEERDQQRQIFARLPQLVGVTVDGWGKSRAQVIKGPNERANQSTTKRGRGRGRPHAM